MSYQDNVSAAAAALTTGEQANWELARLTYQSTPQPGDRPDPPRTMSMAQWARDVAERSGRRFSSTTASVYRRIWSEYGGVGERRPSWGEAYETIAGGPIRERFATYELRSGLKLSDPETRREAIAQVLSPAERLDLIREQLADATVQAEIAAQPFAVKSALTSAVWEVTKTPDAAVREPRAPSGSAVERMEVLHKAAVRVQQLATELDNEIIIELLESGEGALWPTRVALRGQLTRLQTVVQRCIEVLPAVGAHESAAVADDEPAVFEVPYRRVAESDLVEAASHAR